MKENKRVLIVDDQPPARQGLNALLIQIPEIEIVGEATNGQESLELIDELRPDVVLIDIQMPGMDGLETIRHIRKRWPEIKVIALTMYPSYRAEALRAGADEFLIKGCASNMLIGAILRK